MAYYLNHVHSDPQRLEETRTRHRSAEVLRLGIQNRAKQANDLDYASLPDSVVEQVRAAWKTNIKDSSGKPLY